MTVGITRKNAFGQNLEKSTIAPLEKIFPTPMAACTTYVN